VPQTQIDIYDVFQTLSSPKIILDIDDPKFTILEENEAHAKVAMTKREDVIGKPFLEAFPDTSKEFTQLGKSQPIESIRRAIRTRRPDCMEDLKYDLRNEKGEIVTRYWRAAHYPLFDSNGNVYAVLQETKDVTEERNIGLQLNWTKQQLDQLLSINQVGTWFWHIKDDYVTTDGNLARMFGINPKRAFAGLPLKELVNSIYPDDRERVEASIQHAVKTGEAYEAEYRTLDSNKDVRWVIARGIVKYDETGEPESFAGTLMDITDRKLAERALRESEARLRFMADSMPQLVWITRPDGYHEYYNKQWYDYTGTTPGQAEGEGWNDIFHQDDRSRAWRRWRQSLKTGEPYEIEYRLYHAPSGEYRWVIGRALPLKDDDGKIVKWYGTCTDIHEQKHTSDVQKFLADASKELASTLDMKKMLINITKLSVPLVADWCSVDLYDEEKGFTQLHVEHSDAKKINQAKQYRRHNPIHINDPTGLAKVVRTGEPEFYPHITNEMLAQFIKEKERLAFMQSLNLRSLMVMPLKENGKTVGGITFVVSDSGRHLSESDFEMANDLVARVSLSMTNARLYADSLKDLKRRKKLEQQLLEEKKKLESRVEKRTHQLQEVNEGLRDEINRRRMIEEELHEYSNELTRSNEELENFAYVASHDLQEPLRKIQAFGNLLLAENGDSLGEDGADYLSRMHAAANRMSTLIEDLLTFSRVTRRDTPRRSVNLNDTIRDVISDLETRINETGAKISRDELPTVRTDPTHMRQLFQNLIGNAIKFHHPGEPPVIKISAKTKRDGVEIRVRDKGIGFDEKYLDRIFSVFQRLHEKSSYEGTGIGLAVCRKIVERYNGTITATSKKGEGATFIVWLPLPKETKR